MSRAVDDEDPSLLMIVLDASTNFWTKREAIRRRQDEVGTSISGFTRVQLCNLLQAWLRVMSYAQWRIQTNEAMNFD